MEAIINILIKSIGWSILHSLWQGAIIYAVLFISFLIWPKMSARVKHNLAFAALVMIFSSFFITFFSIFSVPVAGQQIQNIAFTEAAYQNIKEGTNAFNLKTEAYFPIVVSVYAVGILFQLIVLISGYVKLKQLKKSSKLMVPQPWDIIFSQILQQLKINKTVQFYLSTKVNVPLVIGFFKPVVLFPVALATQLDLQQVEAILIHELSHIRRNDYLINLVKTCIETILFFNPFVWLTTKFIHIEREHACDDLVVDFTGTPLTYAHALLKLELLKSKQKPALSLAATGNNQHLYQRIKRITNMKTNYMNAKQQIFILTLAVATIASLAWISPAKKAAGKAKKQTSLALITAPATEFKGLKNHLVTKSDTDTTKIKKKFKVVITDDKGNEKVYHSLQEMPDSLKNRIFIHRAFADSLIEHQLAFVNSAEWKSKMADIEKRSAEMSKKYNSAEWKKNMEDMQKNALAMTKQFESPEWKNQMIEVQKSALEHAKIYESPKWKKNMEDMQKNALAMTKQFDTPEWKNHIAEVQKNALEIAKTYNSPEWKDEIAEVRLNAEKMNKKINSKEWKEKVEAMKKLQESPEYKKLREKYEKDLEELKKKKGIKEDKSFLFFDNDGEMMRTSLPRMAVNTRPVFASRTALNIEPNVKLEVSPTPSVPADAKRLLIDRSFPSETRRVIIR